jgi:hypothetical protein
MSNLLKYTDVPIFANFTGENGSINSSSPNDFFAATSASLSINPNLVQNRFVNITQDRNNFSHNGPLEARFSFTFYPLIETTNKNHLNIQKNNQLAFFNLTGDFVSGHNIKIANLTLKKCFLQNYSIKIEPFKPVSVSANFTVYDLSTSINTSITNSSTPFSIYTSGNIPNYQTLHGTAAKMLDNDSYGKIKTSIDISVETERTPVYVIGDIYPNNVILRTVERTTSIKSENIGKIIDITGGSAGRTSLYLMPYSLSFDPLLTPNAQTAVLSFDISGRISSQQMSVTQNQTMEGSIVVKEIIL